MNERIRELALQADLIRVLNEHAHEYGNGTFDNTLYPELEKFAELIVRDVVEQIIIRERNDGEWYQHDIFKHFGVE
jgi:hypothetical protein